MEIVPESGVGSYSPCDVPNKVSIRPARANDSDFLGWVDI
jgi:hypothetical protein